MEKQNLFKNLKDAADLLGRITMFIVIILTALMIGTVLIGIVFRYIIHNSLSWTEELARYLMIWAALLTISVGIKDKEHVGIHLLLKKLPLGTGKAIIFLVNIVILIFLSILTYKGYFMAVGGFKQLSLGLGINMFWPLLSIPVSGGMAIIQQLIQIIMIFNPEAGYNELLGDTEVEEALKEVELHAGSDY